MVFFEVFDTYFCTFDRLSVFCIWILLCWFAWIHWARVVQVYDTEGLLVFCTCCYPILQIISKLLAGIDVILLSAELLTKHIPKRCHLVLLFLILLTQIRLSAWLNLRIGTFPVEIRVIVDSWPYIRYCFPLSYDLDSCISFNLVTDL